MHTTLLAGFAAASLLLLGMSNSHAAPASGFVIGRAADLTAALQDAAWYIRRKCWQRRSGAAPVCHSWRVWRPY